MPQSLQTQRRRGRPAEPLDQRILRLADRSGECWLWTGRLDKDGYGRITVRQYPARAHRVSYEAFIGSIPDGLEIDHLCRVRHCVNPEHLEPVPHRVNVIRSFRSDDGTDPSECIHGHPFDDSNTYWVQGTRQCRECHRKRNREYAARQRAAIRAAKSGGAS